MDKNCKISFISCLTNHKTIINEQPKKFSLQNNSYYALFNSKWQIEIIEDGTTFIPQPVAEVIARSLLSHPALRLCQLSKRNQRHHCLTKDKSGMQRHHHSFMRNHLTQS